jgi:3'-5' exoribonuclease
VFGERSELWAIYRIAPAAKHYHQAYAHGLLEHCLTVAQAVSAISATFPGIDRDVAVTGALLHDIGKLEAYTYDMPIDMTDAGRLQGEIPLGYYRVRRLIEDLPGFPPELAQSVLHIILAHHGSLEHGSPVVPCTREATLVHMIDNLGGRLGSFDRLEKQLARGAAWSSYDRALGSGAYFGSATITAEDRRGQAEAA